MSRKIPDGYRHFRLSPFGQYLPIVFRVSRRRGLSYVPINTKKDRVWHRACKRSNKHFSKRLIQEELQE